MYETLVVSGVFGSLAFNFLVIVKPLLLLLLLHAKDGKTVVVGPSLLIFINQSWVFLNSKVMPTAVGFGPTAATLLLQLTATSIAALNFTFPFIIRVNRFMENGHN